MIRFLMCLLLLVLPTFTQAAWTDNLIFHAPFNDPSDPLEVTVGSGAFVYTSSSSATYIHPTTGLVTIAPTNFAPYSEELSNSSNWATASARVVDNQVTAPDGTMTADELIIGPSGDGSTSHTLTMTVGSTAINAISESFTASIYVKPNTNTWINLDLIGKNGTSNNCYFNTSTGEIGTCSATSTIPKVTSEANGFYRFAVTATLGPTTGVVPKLRVYFASANGTRSFTGNNTNSIYLWGAQINSGGPSPYVKTTASPVSTARIESGGVLLEHTRKNYLLWSRDMTQNVWVKTNVSSSTATGHDGVADSATQITATANNATVCQAIVLASASTSVSVDIKRVSGTGSVSLSMDNGSTYGSDLSGFLSTTNWYRGYKEDQVVTNPTFCIKLGTSGDSFIFDYAQSESGAFISSRIPTTITAQTRYITKLSIQSSGNWSGDTGSFFAIADTWDTARGNKFLLDAGGNPTKIPIHIRSAQGNGSGGILGRTTTYEGTECSYSSVNVDPQTSTKMAARWDKPGNTRGTTASGAPFTNCTFLAPLGMAASSTLAIGDAWLQDGTRSMFGHIKHMMVWNTALPEATLSMATEGNTNVIGPSPTVIASTTTSISETAATLNGSTTAAGGYDITSRGFAYGTTVAYGATTTDSGTYSTGPFSANLTSLTCNTTYYFRAYAVNTAGVGYSSGTSFTTSSCSSSPTIPTISNATTSSVTSTTVTLNSIMTNDGNASTTARGFNYGTTVAYGATTTESGTFGIGPFSANLSGLACNTTYYIRSYSTNSAGTGYGTGNTFTTSACSPTLTVPTLDTPSSGSISSTSVTLSSAILSDGNASSTVRGFNYGTTVSYGATTSESGTYGNGSFSLSLTGLTCNTTYYFRGFATNSEGSGFSSGSSFTTSACSDDGEEETPAPERSTKKSSSVRSRINNLVANGNIQAAQNLATEWSQVVTTNVTVPSVSMPNVQNTNTINNNTKPVFTNIDLELNIVHEDVRKLQKYLNELGFYIAKEGPGSPGNETNIFGPLTKSALIRFQLVKNIYPAAGYFGPLTRKFIQSN